MEISNLKEKTFYGLSGANNSGKTSLLKSFITGETSNKIGTNINMTNKYKNKDVYLELKSVFGKNIDEQINNNILKISKYFEISDILEKKTVDLLTEEKEIINIVKILLLKPEILILDDPFLSLKRDTKTKIIKKLINLDLTMIIATTNLEDLLLSDYLFIIDNNKVVLEGKTKKVLEKDTYLKNLGLEIPFSVDLSLKLKFYEIYNKTSIDYNEVIKNLWN